MWKNYCKIAIRNLTRNGLFSFINIFGLGLSMSICLVVLMGVKDRLGYDSFHPQPDRIFRIITQLTNKEGSSYRFASSPLPLAPALSSNYDLCDAITRIYVAGGQNIITPNKTLHLQPAFTEPAFFRVFGFSLQQGDTATALQQPNSIVLSRAAAQRIFGREDVLGQTLQTEQWGNFLVTGVLNDPPGKSHLNFDAYTSISSVPLLESRAKLAPALNNWNSPATAYTYLRIKKGVSQQQLDRAIFRIADNLMKISKLEGKENIAFETQKLSAIALGEELLNRVGDTESRGKKAAEILIAFIILLMASFNYTNLSIARSLKRGKEVGIRKVSGALRPQIFTQFIIESVFTALLSLGLAMILLNLIMNFAPFASEIIPPGVTVDSSLLGWFLLFSLFAGLLAGVLPAWALSSFKPVDVLKNLSTVRLFGGQRFRIVLTVAQFSLSLFIIIFTVISSSQFHYMATADPGFRRDHILNISLNGTNSELLSNAIGQLHSVQQVSASSELPGEFGSARCQVRSAPGADPINMDECDADTGFIDNLSLKLLAGSSFPAGAAGPLEKYVVLNQTAVQALKLKTPAAALGKILWVDDTTQLRVVGVIRDFYDRGLDMSIAPLVLRHRPMHYNYLNVRTAGDPDKRQLAAMEKIWKTANPGQPFNYRWLSDELYDRKAAWTTVSLLGFLAFIAITIACLGLLGMVIYNTETRRKEIGIRKVMGAGVSVIMLLLSKGYLKLILIAGTIALPLSYIAGRLFLQIFATRITIGAGMLAGSFIGLLLLVLLTIGFRIYRVAAANPVHSLRTE